MAERIKTVARSAGPCGKIGYLTKKAAKAAARNHRHGAHMRAYRCADERCAGLPWHLTTGHLWERQAGDDEVVGDFVVVGLAVITDGKLLCVRKSPAHRWIIPGGKIEPGETETAALRREVREEISCDAERLFRLGVMIGPSPDVRGVIQDGCAEIRVWRGELVGEPRPDNEITELAWMPITSTGDEFTTGTLWTMTMAQLAGNP